jgi:hypothetical protein
MRKTPPVNEDFCEETALAVRRFDWIAGRKVLPSPQVLIQWSMKAFVGGDQEVPQGDVRERATIEAAKLLRYPEQITVTKEPGDVYFIELRDYRLGFTAGQRIPHSFADHTAERVARWKDRLFQAGRLREDLSHEEVLQAILEHVGPTVVAMGRKVGVPDEVLHRFEKKAIYEIVVTPFMYGAVAQDWYCIQRAIGKKPGRIAETLGRDLVITFYIPMAWRFVVSDLDFAKLIGKVLPAGALMTFEEFRDALLNDKQCVPE